MKRLVIFLVLLVAAIGFTFGQEVVLGKTQYYGAYTTATTVSGTTVNNMDVFVQKDHPYDYTITWAADSAGDGTDFSLQLSGSIDGTTYYSIGSAVTWYVSASDTIIKFTNVAVSGNETWTIAQHTEVNAQHTEVTAAYLITCSDTLLYSDTLNVAAQTNTVGAQTVTVGAQTYTIAKPYPVAWRYLRVAATGAGSGAGCSVDGFKVSIVRRD